MTVPEPCEVEDVAVEDHNGSYDSDDELYYDEYDSDENPISHEVRKKNIWYADFFETLDSLTVDQINEPTRQWHCPACKDGPGAIDPLKQMNEENQQLHWYKDKVVTHQMHAKALEESIDLVSAKLRKKEVEDRIKKERTQQHCEELEEALDSQEQFFKDQLKLMKDARNAKENQFDKLQEEDRVRVEGSYSAVDPQREEKLEEIKEFKEEKEKLKSMYMKKRIELEKWFDTQLTRLMDKYTHIN